MTPAQLNQLPEAQQRNALLAIALGRQIGVEDDSLYLLYEGYCDEDGVESFGGATLLAGWSPEQDGALMWRLFSELAKREYYENQSSFLGHTVNQLSLRLQTTPDNKSFSEELMVA
jgi:hypothetical protein